MQLRYVYERADEESDRCSGPEDYPKGLRSLFTCLSDGSGFHLHEHNPLNTEVFDKRNHNSIARIGFDNVHGKPARISTPVAKIAGFQRSGRRANFTIAGTRLNIEPVELQ